MKKPSTSYDPPAQESIGKVFDALRDTVAHLPGPEQRRACAYPDVDHPVIIGQVVDSVDDLPPAGSARDVAVEQLPTLAPPAPARVLEVTDQLFLLGWSGPKGTVAKSGVGAWPTPTA